MSEKTLSAKEKCVALYHQELAAKQEMLLLEDPFRNQLAQRCGVDPEEFSNEMYSIIIEVGKAIMWSAAFHIMAKAVGDAYKAEVESYLQIERDVNRGYKS